MQLKNWTARTHYIVAFWTTLVVSIGLLVGGFFTPPRAEIDGSLLEGAGLLFLWAALSFGNKALEEGKTTTIQHGQTTITVSKEEEQDNNFENE